MKLACYRTSDGDRLALVIGDGLVSLEQHLPDCPRDMLALIAQWPVFRDRVAAIQTHSPDVSLANVQLRAPIPRPGKIMAIGLNYKDHIKESNIETPKHQTWFFKASTCVTGPYDEIALPAVSEQLDYEVELVAIIGKTVHSVSREEASDAIFGYCVGNDVSVRDWQLRTSQWVLGKSFDTHGPFGPWITTADETHGGDLGIRCLVNGEVRQSSNTSELVFDCYAQVEYLSQVMTLEPGDVIFTGTPGGVGMFLHPPAFLRAGDVVRSEIDNLGYIENVVTADPAGHRAPGRRG